MRIPKYTWQRSLYIQYDHATPIANIYMRTILRRRYEDETFFRQPDQDQYFQSVLQLIQMTLEINSRRDMGSKLLHSLAS